MIVPKIYRIQLSLFMRTESNKSDLNYRHDVVNKTYLFYKKKIWKTEIFVLHLKALQFTVQNLN